MEYPKRRCLTCNEWFTPIRKDQVRCSKKCREKTAQQNWRKKLSAALDQYERTNPQ